MSTNSITKANIKVTNRLGTGRVSVPRHKALLSVSRSYDSRTYDCVFNFLSYFLVGIVGLEPTRPFGHQILSLTRLPIPSYPQIKRILGVCSPTQQHHWRFSVFSNEPSWIHSCMLNAPHRAALFHAREAYGGFQARPTTTFLTFGRIDYSPYP